MATISLLADTRPVTRRTQEKLGSGDAAVAAMVQELKGSDLVVANLETPLSRGGYPVPNKYRNLRSDPVVIEDVKALGIQAVTLANNHMLDFGPEALADTLSSCEAAGVPCCGAGMDLEAAFRPLIFELQGKKVGLINLASTVPIGYDAGVGKPGLAPLRVDFAFEVNASFLVESPGAMPEVRSWVKPKELEELGQRIAKLKGEVDVAIVSLHWGVPDFWLCPAYGMLAQYQQPLAHALIDAGADVVYGHHSHTLHPIELYNGKPIFYSPGNFFFEFDFPRPYMERKGFIAKIGVGEGLSVELVPLVHDERGFPSRAFGADAQQVLGKLVEISGPFKTRLAIEGDRAYLQLK